MKLFNKNAPFVALVTIVLFFFKSFIFSQQLPIPSDTIIGLYHPFRDLYSKDYPNGIPFKNFLVTDPVRQQYPWRELAVSIEKKLDLPLWNPYSFSGTPLLANMQTAAFYPLNFLFFMFPFGISWSILIVLEPLLGGLFLYWYLNNLKLNKWASFLGGVSFALSGFFVAWLEWGTILHVGLWLSLILLSIDKIVYFFNNKKFSIFNFQFSIWPLIFIFSLTSSFFAGHLQTFFYVFLVSQAYFFVHFFQSKRKKAIILSFIILNSLFIILAAIQWIPTLQFILYSGRDIDQATWQQEGWFIPWQHLIQFIAPDFFGNPTTLNYWGIWNYGEFIGYVGIFPLLMAIFALFFRHDKKTLLFGTLFFISLLFSLPTILAKLPFVFDMPLLSTGQPTRLLFVTDFCLAMLAAFGLDYLIKSAHKRWIIFPIGFLTILLFALWGFVYMGATIAQTIPLENLAVAKRNLIFPTLMFVVFTTLLLILMRFPKVHRRFTIMIYIIIVVVSIFDLMRFGFKFTSFTDKAYLFPKTEAISFLQKQNGQFRIMTTDSRILPPNFSVIYRLQTVDGYDPLYLQRYGELIAASERDKPDITPPFGFNRIITPHNYDSKIIDLLGVKYIVSLSDLKSPKLKKVFQEGQTQVYENKSVLPRVFFVENAELVNDKNDVIEKMFEDNFDLRKTALVEKSLGVLANPPLRWTKGEAEIIAYTENKIVVNTKNEGEGFLVFTDSFYPTWHVNIDDKETKIFRTDYNFRGVVLPKGKHTVVFYNTLL